MFTYMCTFILIANIEKRVYNQIKQNVVSHHYVRERCGSMKSSFYLTKKQRNIYVRRMVNILIDKYLIERPKLARGIGMSTTHISDFVRATRTVSNPTLDKIEGFINDLYEPIIRDEIEINQMFIEELIANTEKETSESYVRTFKSGIKPKVQ